MGRLKEHKCDLTDFRSNKGKKKIKFSRTCHEGRERGAGT
jgi:hypothetical protein